MHLSYSLSNQVAVEKIVHDLQKLCGKIPREEISNTIIVISLQKITDYTENNPIPKITYNEQNDG